MLELGIPNTKRLKNYFGKEEKEVDFLCAPEG